VIPLQIQDHFAEDAQQVREAVIAGEFQSEQGPDGALYSGISHYAVPQWHALIAAIAGFPITVRLECFRLNLSGELPKSWVHADDICSTYASVLYLNAESHCRGGTAFWRHAGLGMDRRLTEQQMAERGIRSEVFHAWMTNEWKNLAFWEMTALIPMQFNRFITYPTCYFHSRYPFEAFGSGPADGRLVWVCFYDRSE
jgi:uncharacterized protein DUF6445